MKSKAPLVLMEQIIMVLVFALASALCLQSFVLAGKISRQTEAKNHAAIELQNTAESLKASGPDNYIKDAGAVQTENGYVLWYDADWNQTAEPEQMAYYMELCPDSPTIDTLWKLELIVSEKDGTELLRIPVAGQAEVVK